MRSVWVAFARHSLWLEHIACVWDTYKWAAVAGLRTHLRIVSVHRGSIVVQIVRSTFHVVDNNIINLFPRFMGFVWNLQAAETKCPFPFRSSWGRSAKGRRVAFCLLELPSSSSSLSLSIFVSSPPPLSLSLSFSFALFFRRLTRKANKFIDLIRNSISFQSPGHRQPSFIYWFSLHKSFYKQKTHICGKMPLTSHMC